MNPHPMQLSLMGLALISIVTACAPKATPPTVDPNTMSTAIARAAQTILTETAAASSPTPTVTVTPTLTPTEAAPVSPTANATPKPPTIGNFTGCWYGPGQTYTLESNISKGARVQVLGIGSVPGWYVIRNPYFHKPCWVPASQLENLPANATTLPVMTPGP